jgi:rod shape-determining protein MreB
MTANASDDVRFVISVNFRDTEVTARRKGEVIWRSEFREGGVDWIIAFMEYLRSKHNLLIGRKTAEKTIVEIGFTNEPLTIIIRGRDMNTGLPTAKEINSEHVSEGITLDFLANRIVSIFREPRISEYPSFPPEIPAELRPALLRHPIILTGEFGRMRGLDRTLQDILGLTVTTETTAN